MTRESKLALILSFVLILVVGVLVSDYFSQASTMDPDRLEAQSRQPIAQLPGTEQDRISSAISRVMPQQARQSTKQSTKKSTKQSTKQATKQAVEPVVIANGSNRNGSLLGGLSNGINKSIADVRGQALASQASATRNLGPITHQNHTVQEGDSLYQIARTVLGDGDRWPEIQSLNADLIGSNGIINPGMKLKLPANARVSTPKVFKATPKPKPSTKSSDSYIVASGDTLGEISMKLLGTSRRADEFVKLNGLDDANDIRVGMKLKVPAK